MIKKTLLILLLLVILIIAVLSIPLTRHAIVSLFLPKIPDLPTAQNTLNADASGRIYFPATSPFDLDVIFSGMQNVLETTGVGDLYLPANISAENPTGLIILAHGSGGIAPGREDEYAQLLNANGYGAFILDYYAPRGASRETGYLAKTASATEFDIIADAYAALEVLSTHPLIDENRIGIMGFSYGAMAARLSADSRFRDNLAPEHPGFAVHIDAYGPCFQNLQTSQTTGGAHLTLRGTEDASNDLEACLLREQELRDLGATVIAHVYAGAGHAWENLTPRVMGNHPYLSGCEVIYDAQGFAMLNGERITTYDIDAKRIERVIARFTSGPKYNDCLHKGYIIGNDPETKTKANQHLLEFLGEHL